MGMDVYGKAPRSETGEYFRRNVWGWRPLADYVEELPGAEGCQHWHSNDGDGLEDDDAVAIAVEIDQSISSGAAEKYIADRNARLASLPREICSLCDGSGVRTDKTGINMGQTTKIICDPVDHPRLGQTGWCNGCDGVGTKPAWETWYDLELSDLKEFSAFLKECGGFEIC